MYSITLIMVDPWFRGVPGAGSTPMSALAISAATRACGTWPVKVTRAPTPVAWQRSASSLRSGPSPTTVSRARASAGCVSSGASSSTPSCRSSAPTYINRGSASPPGRAACGSGNSVRRTPLRTMETRSSRQPPRRRTSSRWDSLVTITWLADRIAARWAACISASSAGAAPNFAANSSGPESCRSNTTRRPAMRAARPAANNVSGGPWKWITRAPRTRAASAREHSCTCATAYSSA